MYLFNRRRKTEPKFIHVLRACIMILLLAFLLAYIIFLINEVIHSAPAVQISVEELDEMPFPDMGFHGQTPFDVDCRFQNGFDEIYSCNDTLSQTHILEQGYFGFSLNKNNLKYTKNTVKGDQILRITLFSNTPNDLISFYLVDSENDPLKSPDNKVYTNTFQFLDFMKELFANNMYRIANNQLSFIGLTRNQKKTIDPELSGILGFNPSYNTTHRIISKLQSTPLPTEPSTGYYSEIELTVTSYRMQVETEQRTQTLVFHFNNKKLLSVFGLMGGAWGLASALYAALFGVDSIHPWGFIQSCYCGYGHRIHNKFKKTMPVLPLINPSSLMTELNSSSPNVKELHDRLISLEIFLKEYVVDVKYLEKSEQMDQNK
ncbi:1787_t:CDS:2 [Funneliformis caledonium]|uniref:1787_t:CDS:1 n=1 Tax=Funneliformis caledonium TaxID=1117310 RepID=A0A9N9FN73_9GLOM|nr:1787_t:CDS:2 [Funneliformis caledonium]